MAIELTTGKTVKVTKKDLNALHDAMKNGKPVTIENHQRGYIIEVEQEWINEENQNEDADLMQAVGLVIDGVDFINEL